MTNNFMGGSSSQHPTFNAPQFLGQSANYNPLGGLMINGSIFNNAHNAFTQPNFCLLYTSDAADE